MKLMLRNDKKAFTLIELLLVIGIIAVLAVVVFVALNPAKRFADARDSRRANDVQTILSAIHQYIVDNQGGWPSPLSANMAQVQLATAPFGSEDCTVANAASGCSVTDAGGCVNVGTALASYVKSLPKDPSLASTSPLSGYTIEVVNGIVTIRSCHTEASGLDISASR